MNAPVTKRSPNTLANRIRSCRHKCRLTQAGLAIKSCTTTMEIIELENGYDDLESALGRIAQAVNCNPAWLETGLGAPNGSLPSNQKESRENTLAVSE